MAGGRVYVLDTILIGVCGTACLSVPYVLSTVIVFFTVTLCTGTALHVNSTQSHGNRLRSNTGNTVFSQSNSVSESLSVNKNKNLGLNSKYKSHINNDSSGREDNTLTIYNINNNDRDDSGKSEQDVTVMQSSNRNNNDNNSRIGHGQNINRKSYNMKTNKINYHHRSSSNNNSSDPYNYKKADDHIDHNSNRDKHKIHTENASSFNNQHKSYSSKNDKKGNNNYTLNTRNIHNNKYRDNYNYSTDDNSSDNTGKHNMSETNLPDISIICPGVKYFTNQTIVETVYYDNVADCDNRTQGFTSGQGVVYIKCQDSRTFCHIHIQAPQDKVVCFEALTNLNETCPDALLYDSLPSSLDPTSADLLITCDTMLHYTRLCVYSSTNHMYISRYNEPRDRFQVSESERERIYLKYLRPHSGYLVAEVTAGVMLGLSEHWKYVQVPLGHVIAIKISTLSDMAVCQAYVRVYHKEHQRVPSVMISVCHTRDMPVKVFNTTRLQTNLRILPSIFDGSSNTYVFFSFFFKGNDPKFLDWNEDVFTDRALYTYYTNKWMCDRGKDEEKYCPSVPEGCMQWVGPLKKCIQFVKNSDMTHPKRSQRKCQKFGGNIALIKTKTEMIAFREILVKVARKLDREDSVYNVQVGLSCGWDHLPFMYSQFCKWSDNTMIYYNNSRYFPERYTITRAYYFAAATHHSNYLTLYRRIGQDDLACEFYSKNIKPELSKPVVLPAVQRMPPLVEERQQALHVCSSGHFTHGFLKCDIKSHCGQISFAFYCKVWKDQDSPMISLSISTSKIVMFSCNDDLTTVVTVPYTLVCNIRPDCPDSSDESFCQHPPCNGFQCDNGECVSTYYRCNQYSDCLDDSDEADCHYTDTKPVARTKTKQSLLINLDGTGYFTHYKMKKKQSCPDTHYRCTSELLYCLPVYTRCNGFYDCMKHEDEQDCLRATCPGFYHCRASTVCVHVDQLCDGWGQCPQRDDEWLCDMTCPVGCQCQGLSFVCSQLFSAPQFSQLRYLDAKGSGLTLSNLSNHIYIVYLSLSHCSLVSLSPVSHSNLQFFDLSNNKFTNISVNDFLGFSNLQVLLLSDNPLTSLTTYPSNLTQNALIHIDISQTYLRKFDSRSLSHFPRVKNLNISFSCIEEIGSGGFQKTPRLTKIDLRGNVISKFPFHAFLGLNMMSTIFSSNYRLCCPQLISELSNTMTCIAPQPLVSSCDNLLQSEFYRCTFWSVSVLTLCGNVLCFISQYTAKHNLLESTFLTFITNLQFANVCSGIHASIIAVANEVFRGQYLLYESTWTRCVMCKLAGCVSLLSGEVSIFIVYLTTLHHVIEFCLPSSTVRVTKMSAAVLCGVTWLFGMLLALLSLLGLFQSHAYGQTGLCHLVLFGEPSSKPESDFLVFLAVFNFIVCAMVGTGQAIICKATPRYRIIADSAKKSLLSSQHLLMNIGITTMVCWSLISITSLMTIAGAAGSDRVNLFMAVFVFPLSSSLYPELFWWSRVHDRGQQKKEQRLLQALKTQFLSQKTYVTQ